MNALRVAGGEFAATALVVLIAFLSNLARAEVGAVSPGGALLGSVALGLGFGLVTFTFGPVSKAHANPLISVLASLGGQIWSEAALRVAAQLLGAGAASAIALHVRFLAATGSEEVRPLADGVAAFGCVLVAMGIARRRDASIPVALGVFATASFWMTGRASLGNPLVAGALLIAGRPHASIADGLSTLAGVIGGSVFGAAAGALVFPKARETLGLLIYRPKAKTNR